MCLTYLELLDGIVITSAPRKCDGLGGGRDSLVPRVSRTGGVLNKLNSARVGKLKLAYGTDAERGKSFSESRQALPQATEMAAQVSTVEYEAPRLPSLASRATPGYRVQTRRFFVPPRNPQDPPLGGDSPNRRALLRGADAQDFPVDEHFRIR
ncbi:hypothetical protein FB451DRAFT_1172318 [Mycena latifolia]|nr:hypothetical protein FB451DRAFT_1172318 [Mycena latifolia]